MKEELKRKDKAITSNEISMIKKYLEQHHRNDSQLMRIVIYDLIKTERRPGCFKLALDPTGTYPIALPSTNSIFKKNFLGCQLYDQQITEPGIYYYENMKMIYPHDFRYRAGYSDYFVLDAHGQVAHVNKGDILQWLKYFKDEASMRRL